MTAAAPSAPPRWEWLGRAPYLPVWQRQLALRDAVLDGAGAPLVLLCEHDPVITLGRSAKPDNVLASPAELVSAGVEVHAIERGGDVTYHGPGQLMIYPVVPIRSVVAFLSTVGGVIAEVCAHYGVRGAAFRCEPAGVWLGEEKLAACGIHVRRGVTVHGWAFNVATPPVAWTRIRPCGGAAPQLSLVGARARAAAGGAACGQGGSSGQAGALAELSSPLAVADVAAVLGPRLAAALPAVMPGGRAAPSAAACSR